MKRNWRQLVRSLWANPKHVSHKRPDQRSIPSIELLEARVVPTSWASSVIDFSSEYSPTTWSAAQALGTPNTLSYGDNSTAWTTLPPNDGVHHITVGFDTPTSASGIIIRETYGNGFVAQVDLRDTDGVFHTIFNGVDPSQPGSPVDFQIDFAATSYVVDAARVYVDTNHSASWEEIDAIVLITEESSGTSGGFDASITISTPGRPRAMVLDDFNHDGRQDLVTANDYPANSVEVLLRNIDGTFAAPVNFAAGATPFSLTTGDFNGDGNQDLVMANYYTGDTVTVLLGNSDGTFGAPTAFAAGYRPLSVATADFNGDSKQDLLVANVYGSSLFFLAGNGDGTFQAPSNVPFSGSLPVQIAVGDFNHDNKQDVAVTNFTVATVSVLLGNGDGTFNLNQTTSIGTLTSEIAVMDLNHDGHLDLVVGSQGTAADTINVMLGNGDGSFQAPISYAVGRNPTSLTVVDLNADGHPDILTGNSSAKNISVLLGNGTGAFTPARNYATGGFSEDLTVFDFNMDGKLDVAMSNFDSSSISIVLGNGDGTLAAPVAFEAHETPGDSTTGDFNEDTVLDLAVSNFISHDVSILIGLGNGAFAAPVNYPVGMGTNRVLAGDFNEDNNLDLVTVNRADDTISLLFGNGDGTFNTAVTFPAATGYPWAEAVSDVNADGHLDLVVDHSLSGIAVHLGNGDGTFQSPLWSTLFPGVDAHTIAMGDFNSDDKPDIISANRYSNDVGILLGNGDGTFSTPTIIPNGLVPAGSATADINADGRLDIITANLGYAVSVLLGNGDGAFAPPYHFPLLGPAGSVAIEDLNGDGKLDIITATIGNNTVSVLYGSGNGNFAPAQEFTAGSLPSEVTIGDFNQDGRPDVVVPNNDSDTVSVLLNRPSSSNVPPPVIPPYGGPVAATGNTRTWTGASPISSNWTDADNWEGNVAPNPGDDLLFPSLQSRVQNVNDFAPGTTFNSITFTGTHTQSDYYRGYGLSGNAIVLNAGITDNSDGVNSLSFATITLGGSQTFMAGSATLLWIVAPVRLNGFDLTLDGATAGDLRGTVSNSGALIKNGSSVWSVWGNNSYTGQTSINAGTLSVKSGTALGSTASGTVVVAGATLDAGYIGFQSAEPLILNGNGVNNVNGALRASPLDSLVSFTGPITLGSDSLIFTSQTAVGLDLSGPLYNNGFNLLLNGSLNTTITGGVYGVGTVTNSALVLSGVGVFDGPVQVTQGTLAPGANGTPGTLATGNVSFSNNTTYQALIAGAVADTGYSQLQVNGAIDLTGSTLQTTLNHFTPDGSEVFTIIQSSTPVSGKFSGLDEGATVTIGGVDFVIHYNYVPAGGPVFSGGNVTFRERDLHTSAQLAMSATNAVLGTSITFTATVTSEATPTSVTVEFRDGGAVLQTISTPGNVAQFDISTLAVGEHSITAKCIAADYQGQPLIASEFTSPQSLTITQVPINPATTTHLDIAPTDTFFGTTITFTATVTAEATPTYVTVEFRDGGTVLQTVSTLGNVAQYTTNSLTVGVHSITAAFVSGNYQNQPLQPSADTENVSISSPPTSNAPVVTINQANGQSDPTSNSSIQFTAIFSVPVTGFATGDVVISGTAGAATAAVSGSGNSYSITVSGMTQSGTVIVAIPAGVAQNANGTGNAASISTDNSVVFVNPITTSARYAVGSEAGQPGKVRVYEGSTLIREFIPYPGYDGSVRVATSDFNGDGVLDIITGPGNRHVGSHVKIIDGKKLDQVDSTGVIKNEALLASYYAFEAWVQPGVSFKFGFDSGIFVAAADIDGDGLADAIVGADEFGGSHLRVFRSGLRSYPTDTKLIEGMPESAGWEHTVDNIDTCITNAFIFDFPVNGQGYNGGIRVSGGDVNGDGRQDIIIGRGIGVDAQLIVIDGTKANILSGVISSSTYLVNTPAFSVDFIAGAFVTAADLNGDHKAEIIASKGKDSSQVRIFSYAGSLTPTQLDDFFAFASATPGGVRLGYADFDGDAVSDLLVATGPGVSKAQVKTFKGATGQQEIGLTDITFETANLSLGLFVG